MSLNNVLSVKDYFHYYFGGLLWIIDFSLLVNALNKLSLESQLKSILAMPSTLLLVLIAFFPFLIGFSMSPFADLFIKHILSKIKDDPVNWALSSDQKYKGKRFAKSWRKPLKEKIQALIQPNKRYEDDKNDYSKSEIKFKTSPYHWVKNYVYLNDSTNRGLEVIERVNTLVNLTESIIFPISIFLYFPLRILFGGCVGIFSSIALFVALCYRYLKLKEYLVKHVYRTFYFLSPVSIEPSISHKN